MTSPTPTPLALCAAVLVAAFGVLGVPSVAQAEEAPSDAVSWSVSPADESGPDGRTSVEHELDPGESVDDHIVVRNLGSADVVFHLAAADGYYTPAGRFDMLPSDQESVAAGTWISLPDEVSVPAGGAVVVPFTVAVPDNAEPGDHAAGVAASVLSIQRDDAGGTGVGVESRVGIKVMTRVTGEIAPAFAVRNLSADYEMTWNPFRAGSATVSFDVANTGNTRLDAAGELSIAGQTIAFPAEGERRQEILPGESRTFTITVPDVWPLVAVGGDLRITPSSSTLAGDPLAVDASTTSVTVWAMPWPQLGLLAGAALLILALLWNRIRSRRRMEALLSTARERGREEALDEARREEAVR
ncbi:hypothetical protein [Microbacterium sp. LWH10-1.2]|uniref:COG1470 family protein n=1 Tax=Microbacterium sp. LWH10-1.2 TaxID=3135255 RepID=UPI003139321E